jgi:hypothetical protein
VDAKVIATLDLYRKKRSMSIYDVAGGITEGEAKAMQALAQELVERVRGWLAQNHPTLAKPMK